MWVVFNAVADGKYLNWDLETGRLVELDKQPAGRYTGPINDLAVATGIELTAFWIDPARGQLLKIMGQSPELGDRVDQGGVVGYVILALGVFGIFLAAVAHDCAVQRSWQNPQANDQ